METNILETTSNLNDYVIGFKILDNVENTEEINIDQYLLCTQLRGIIW